MRVGWMMGSLLVVCLGACGGNSSSDDPNGGASKEGSISACVEACLEVDACDPTFATSEGFCTAACEEAANRSFDIDCGKTFEELSACTASSNDCPTPACLAENRAHNACVQDNLGDLCEASCEVARACPGSEETSTCESDCADSRAELETDGCGAEYDAFLACYSVRGVCDVDEAFEACDAEVDALLVCAAG